MVSDNYKVLLNNNLTCINDNFFTFIEEHEDDDVEKLRLKRFSNHDFDTSFAITQIECRKKIRKKLPEIYGKKRFLFPSVLSTEQCTSEVVAKYHATIIGEVDSFLDMTGGLCIDDYYIADNVKELLSIEKNEHTADISRYNMSEMRKNISVISGDSAEYLRGDVRRYDAIYIDPARRGVNQSRMFGLSDCEPNIIPLLSLIKSHTDVLYVKASPMLDITQMLREVSDVTDIWVISLRNECKELFFKLDFALNKRFTIEESADNIYESPKVHCINFVDENTMQELNYSYLRDKTTSDIIISDCVKHYIYEPNASIMKANAFGEVCSRYKVDKVAVNSHLFTSGELVHDFPGRIFQVEDVIPFKDNLLKKALKGIKRINVSVRNFKLTAEQLKKRLKVCDGGSKYLFGTTDAGGEMKVLLCSKI